MTSRGRHVDELISASLAGELTDAERVELDAHLVGCETCRNTLAAFAAERRILSGLPVAEPPRDLGARVLSGIESGRTLTSLGPVTSACRTARETGFNTRTCSPIAPASSA